MNTNGPASLLHPAEMCGFLVTRDAARCREFFAGRLGFRVRGEDEQALVLEADGRMLRVQKMKAHEPRPYTVLGWNVHDIETAVTRLATAGVSCERFGFPGRARDHDLPGRRARGLVQGSGRQRAQPGPVALTPCKARPPPPRSITACVHSGSPGCAWCTRAEAVSLPR